MGLHKLTQSDKNINMKILAIETSCDETAIAILEVGDGQLRVGKETRPHFKILSNVVLSQIKIHKPYGGVVPNLAMREHKKNLPIILKRALRDAGINLSPNKNPDVDIIAVTYGPGLEPALWEGINFAKDLAEKRRVPLAAVNHLEGHIYAAWLNGGNPKFEIRNSKWGLEHPTPFPPPLKKGRGIEGVRFSVPQFPLLALIVSGGHTELVLMKKHLDYKILGETLDDAAGEAFDKVARMLGLGYPGGPEISKLAEKWETSPQRGKRLFPRPMINSPDFNFSFSGLKTAVLYYLRAIQEEGHPSPFPPPLTKGRGIKGVRSSSKNRIPLKIKTAIAYEFQQAVVDVLVKKTADALRKYRVRSLVVGGGVAANKKLRATLEQLIATKFPQVSLFLSPPWLCGDNAAMIAVAAYFKARACKFPKPESIIAQGNLRLQ